MVGLRCEDFEEVHFRQRKQPRVRWSGGGRYLLTEPVESLNDTCALALECSVIRQVPESFSSDKSGQRGKWGPHPCFLYTSPLSLTLARPRSRTGGERQREPSKKVASLLSHHSRQAVLDFTPEGPTLSFPRTSAPANSLLPPRTGKHCPSRQSPPAEWIVSLSLSHLGMQWALPSCSAQTW